MPSSNSDPPFGIFFLVTSSFVLCLHEYTTGQQTNAQLMTHGLDSAALASLRFSRFFNLPMFGIVEYILSSAKSQSSLEEARGYVVDRRFAATIIPTTFKSKQHCRLQCRRAIRSHVKSHPVGSAGSNQFLYRRVVPEYLRKCAQALCEHDRACGCTHI